MGDKKVIVKKKPETPVKKNEKDKSTIFHNRENYFLGNNRDKKITIILLNEKQVSGILQDIDMYRLGLLRDDKVIWYYKHAVQGYFAGE